MNKIKLKINDLLFGLKSVKCIFINYHDLKVVAIKSAIINGFSQN